MDYNVFEEFAKSIGEGYDGIRYYDPYTTGEELGLFNRVGVKRER